MTTSGGTPTLASLEESERRQEICSPNVPSADPAKILSDIDTPGSPITPIEYGPTPRSILSPDQRSWPKRNSARTCPPLPRVKIEQE